MDFVPGKKLVEFRFDEPLDGKLPPELAFQILRPIASALDYIHEANVLHGDVRPENILVVESAGLIRDVRLIDFGLATRFGENADESDEMQHDNPRYKAPEQLHESCP